MTQYIDKDALVAEIERLRERDYPCDTFEESTGYYNALDEIASFINTLEVKEVDLEKELIEWHKVHFKKGGTFVGLSGCYLTNNSQMDFAKHFFELGIKAAHNNS